MNVAIKSILACAIIMTLCHSTLAEYDVNAYCTLVKNGVKLASVDDCQTFYTCMNGKATVGQCQSTQAFDKDSQNCRPKSDVKCYFGIDQPCVGQPNMFVPIVNTCNGYIYCKDGKEAGRGQCPTGQIFHQGNCVYGSCNDNVNGGPTNEGLTSVCQIMPDKTFFGSTKNCKIWQVCDNGELKNGNCPTDLVFDVNLSTCNYETANMCSRVTGQDIQPDPTPSAGCSEADKDKQQADSSKCSSYQVCDGKYWINYPCANGQYYSPDVKKCVARQSATPVDGCNRCEFTKRQFVNAVDPACRKYYVCSNGVVQGTGYCAADSYFDEATQACVKDTDGLKDYAAKNGACKNDGSSGGSCTDTCKALSGNNCKKSGECDCGLDADSKCEVCANGYEGSTNKCATENSGGEDCPAKCEALGKDGCEPITGAEPCKCGLTGDDCGVCGVDETVDADNKCATCTAYCDGLVLANCEENDDCACGKEDEDATKCIVCEDGSKNGICNADCEALCKGLGDTEEDCKTNLCDCGLHNGECTNCAKEDDPEFECNGCICKAAEPACPDDVPCECIDDGSTCISCPNGIDPTDDTKCKDPE